jgi:SSS family solute:Na+ symporter
MQLIDWILITVPLLFVFSVGIYTQRYMRSVADFMSGGRLAGRYLLAVARGEMLAGAVVFVSGFEVISQAGFISGWWYKLSAPITVLVVICGFVVYRYRETRVMTLAQFFEVRYSRRFRVFTGGLGFIAGILNFGIIPAVGSRFLVYFLTLPTTLTWGSLTVPTYIPIMAAVMTFNVIVTLSGGLITLMVVDCIEGIISQLAYLVIITCLLFLFSWSQMRTVLVDHPPGHSFVNPFDTGSANDFNLTFVLMGIFATVYGTMAWQNASAYNSAALTPHESRMGGLLGRWREMGKGSVIALLALCGMTFLGNHDFAAQSQHAHALINQIPEAQIREQMSVPIAVTEMLPPGIKGLLCAIMIFGVFGGDSTHLHSWGSIFVQDVILPLRKKPFGPKEHIRALRFSIIGVALFAFTFSALFRQTEYITMWFQVTTGIFVSGAGIAIIGGLYWTRGTTMGAWGGMLTGSILSLGGIVARQIYGNHFWLNGTQISFCASMIAVTLYVVVSLLTCRADFNLERMLHRGPYALATDPPAKTIAAKFKVTWGKLLGFDDNFTLSDKWIAGGVIGYSLFWFFMLLVFTGYNFAVAPISLDTWTGFWHVFGIGVPVFFTVLTGIWFTWGGVRDIRRLMISLKTEKVNPLDDGTVRGHQNLDEFVAARPEVAHRIPHDANRSVETTLIPKGPDK